VDAIGDGRVRASTSVEAIQELAHVRARHRGRADAVAVARAYAALLAPLLDVGPGDLDAGLRLFERHAELGSFDAVLAAAAIERDAQALVSADQAFGSVRRLRFVDLGSVELEALVGAA
jgi:predicted nucleic acid-binding protein